MGKIIINMREIYGIVKKMYICILIFVMFNVVFVVIVWFRWINGYCLFFM